MLPPDNMKSAANVWRRTCKLAARKHDEGLVHRRQKLEVAIRKEPEAFLGNDFLIQLFADRNTAVLLSFDPDECNSVLDDLRTGKVYSFAPSCPCAKADFDNESEKGTVPLAVEQKLCDLLTRQPGHFLFCNGDLTHVFQWVRRSLFSKTGQFAKYSAQIALLQIDSHWGGTFLPLLTKVDFIRQTFIAIVREQFGTEICCERVSKCIDHQDQLVVNMFTCGSGICRAV